MKRRRKPAVSVFMVDWRQLRGRGVSATKVTRKTNLGGAILLQIPGGSQASSGKNGRGERGRTSDLCTPKGLWEPGWGRR